MQGDPSPAESKAASGLDHGYKCHNCSRVFNSSRARGGHQIAHRKKRPIRRTRGAAPISPVLAAVLAHHVSSDDDDDDDEPPKGEMALQQVGINLQARESVTKDKNEAVQLMSKVKDGTSQHLHAGKKPFLVGEKLNPQKELRTIDLLGLWNPNAGCSPEGLSDKITLDLFSTRDPKDESDDLDLGLQLRSKNTEKVSLKLKLGF